VTTSWVSDPAGAQAAGVTCRGCAKPIRHLGGQSVLWEDATGITVCVKARLEDIGHGERPDFVFHKPMPAGMRGALPHGEEEKTDG
jgi:hypothetical protein